MKVKVYYTEDPDDDMGVPAYLNDDGPLETTFRFGSTKHSDRELWAHWVIARQRWEIIWIEKFDPTRYM